MRVTNEFDPIGVDRNQGDIITGVPVFSGRSIPAAGAPSGAAGSILSGEQDGAPPQSSVTD
jgi:hypothetical protein